MAAPEMAEFAERPSRLQGFQVRAPFLLLDLIGSQLQPALADVKLDRDSGHVLDAVGEPGEPVLRVGFPEPVAGRLGKITKLLLT